MTAEANYTILFTINSLKVHSQFSNFQSHRSTVGFIDVINIYNVQ